MSKEKPYLAALKESVGAEHFDLALRTLLVARSLLKTHRRLELEKCENNRERALLIDKWFGNLIAPAIKNMIILLAEAHELSILDSVSTDERQIIEVVTASPLNSNLKNWFGAELQKKCGDHSIVFKIDPKIIAGVKIKIGDREIDNSLSLKLNKAYSS